MLREVMTTRHVITEIFGRVCNHWHPPSLTIQEMGKKLATMTARLVRAAYENK